jgi:hypothetical protein
VAALGCAVAACGTPAPAEKPDTAPAIDLVDARVARAAAGDPGWAYQQRVVADLDRDGTRETAVLIADVALGAGGQPLWEDGHRWQVYVEEDTGARTYLYARFLPNGRLTADLGAAPPGEAPTIVLFEQTPDAVAAYELRYEGPDRTALVQRFARGLDRANTFQGLPRP